MAKFAVILPAAGRSNRFKDKNYKKPFVPMANKAVWLHSAERFLGRDDVVQTILIISPEDRADFISKFGANIAILGIDVVDGGTERADSVQAALARVKPQADFVCIHDAARPCICDRVDRSDFSAAEQSDAAIFAIPVAGTLKRVGANHEIEETVARGGALGGANPASVPPRADPRGIRQAARAASHRRRPTGRADRPQSNGRARLAGEYENHHHAKICV